jgi:hypothetical protein
VETFQSRSAAAAAEAMAIRVERPPCNVRRYDKTNRSVILMRDEMLKALDEWRWENRISSRGEAIRMMVADKLEREAGPPKRGKDKPK